MTRWALVPLLIMALSAPAAAQNAPDRIVLAAGYHNFDDADSIHRESDFRVEWRIPSLTWWRLYPWVGVEMVSQALGWFGAGAEMDFEPFANTYLTLQTGVGYWDNGSQRYKWRDVNPDSGLEFRHQAEFGLKMPTGNRVGIGVSHMSNAGIGGHGNPGKNSLTVNFHIPLGFQVGRKSVPTD